MREVWEILRRRAQELARRRKTHDQRRAVGEVTVAYREGHPLAFPTEAVREVLRTSGEPLPPFVSLSSLLRGVVQVRGQVFPIVDLKSWLRPEGQREEETPLAYVVLVDTGRGTLAVGVDEVEGSRTLWEEELDPEGEVRVPCARYMTKEAMVVFDPERLAEHLMEGT